MSNMFCEFFTYCPVICQKNVTPQQKPYLFAASNRNVCLMIAPRRCVAAEFFQLTKHISYIRFDFFRN